MRQEKQRIKHNSHPMRYYGKGIRYIEDTEVKGRLIVIEGPDASGRSTQIGMLTAKLEADGHAGTQHRPSSI